MRSGVRRALSLAALAASLCLCLAGCGGRSGGAADGLSRHAGPKTVNELSAKLAATYSTQPWYGKITGITLRKKLGVPVVSVWVTSTGPDDQAYAQDEQILKTILHLDPGMADVFETRDRWGSRVIVARQHSQLSPSPLPPPKNAGAVKTWLAKMYGPRGELPVDEPWYASIRSIAYDDQWRADALVVNTSLKDDAAGVEQAELIQAALSGAGITFAKNLEVQYTDGSTMDATIKDLANDYR
jgi:hypothetical protein